MSVLCKICNENISKYKCSICFSPFCSAQCWKNHKNDINCKPNIPVKQACDVDKNITTSKYFTEDTVKEEKLKQLGESEKIKNMVKNNYLKNILLGVENALNPEEAIRLAMKNPEFVEFVDEALKIVEDVND